MNKPRKHRLILMPSGRKGEVEHGTTLLEAAEGLGVEIESICAGRQTCGKCLVEPEVGVFEKHGIHSAAANISPPGAAEQGYAQEHGLDLEGQRLSCAAKIVGDLLVHIPEGSQARKQVIRKAASDLTLEVDPLVKLFYVEVEPPMLGGPGDWQRLQTAMAEQWDLPHLTLDPLLLRSLQNKLRDGDWGATVTVWKGEQVIRVEPGYVESLYGVAIDVGSTTIALYLCDLRTGELLATQAMMNPQVRYGEDLMSRVSYGMREAEGVTRMHRAVLRSLNELVETACREIGIDPEEITDAVLVGNTVMHHLMLGIDPVQLGGAPFTLATHDPVDLLARDFGLTAVHPGGRVHLLPCIAGHVGADNVGVLLAEQASLDERTTLIVDIGTNAEILLGNRQGLLSASSPTGPAFEGAQISHGQRAAPGAVERVRIEHGRVRYKVVGDDRWNDELGEGESLRPTGICGSGIIEVLGELFRNGLLDSGGLFVREPADPCPAIRYTGRTAELVLEGSEETSFGGDLVVTQQDIRAVQLAKAALYAGAKLLMEKMGVERVDRVKLAGAFGSYIDPLYALLIGLVPDCDLEQVEVIGNAAGDGARIALLNQEQRRLAARAAREVTYVETATASRFQEQFVEAMSLPHAKDPFPHIEGHLGDTIQAADRDRGDARRSRARSLN